MLRAVIFDMDDTLLDWSRREGDWMEIHQSHLGPVCAYVGETGQRAPELARLVETYVDALRRAWESIDPQAWDCPNQTDILRETLRAADIAVDKLDMLEVQRRFGWRLIPGVCAFDDSAEVLRRLRAQGIRTGLITNAVMPMWMRDTELREVGLLDYLDVRLTAGDVGKLKPHPRPFQVAMERLGVAPSEAVFVGDRVMDDVAGAQMAGMRGVWVRRNSLELINGAAKPNATIDQLQGLFKVLDLWYPGWGRSGGSLPATAPASG